MEREVARGGGEMAGSTGDGTVAIFDGPTPAILAALTIRDALREIGLEIRAGIHMGEVIRSATDIEGIGVHIGARVAAEAAPGEVLVSSTVHDA
ncbi:MAG TPA: adenylate/guanylate cyclase domain-containing protein, partial [Gemmatimonadota bacterium]|nr:adenylate/guanylate cyclase domain-containing protein [Gemmatimonadota bacterium]